MGILCRPAGSFLSINNAMSRVVEVENSNELLELINRHEIAKVKLEDITFKHCGYDERINWDTYLICVKDKQYGSRAVLFSNGIMKITLEMNI